MLTVWDYWRITTEFVHEVTFSSPLLLSSLELVDTNVYEPYMRALLGIAVHFCKAVVVYQVTSTLIRVWGLKCRV